MSAPKHVDGNQPVIVRALRGAGAKVRHTHTVGQGYPDLCVLYHGEIYLLEVKMPHCALTPDETAFFEEWAAGQVHVVTSAEQALDVIGALD